MRSFAASAITRLPAASAATAQVFTDVPAAGPPSRNGPLVAVPTGVVSAPDAGSMLRTVQLSATRSCPLPNETPQGALLMPATCVDTPRFTLVGAAGPPRSSSRRRPARSCSPRERPMPGSPYRLAPRRARGHAVQGPWDDPQVVRSGGSRAAGRVNILRLSGCPGGGADNSFAAGTCRLPPFLD